MPWKRFAALLGLATLVMASTTTATQKIAPDAQETPTGSSVFTYLGQTFAINDKCAVDQVVVGTASGIMGSSVSVLSVVVFPGGFNLVGPHDYPASDAYAGKNVGDDVCLNP